MIMMMMMYVYLLGLVIPGKQSHIISGLTVKTTYALSTRWKLRRIGGRFLSSSSSSSLVTSTPEDDHDATTTTTTTATTTIQPYTPPWNLPTIPELVRSKRKKNNRNRFRQHVNPLARRYQQSTQLPIDWPSSVFTNVQNKPLFLDIGCAKGKFLMDVCEKDTSGRFNYLGLEIRPGIAELARQRISSSSSSLHGRIDFIGCNANVDLHRILQLYHQHATTTTTPEQSSLLLQTVTIQFPDPHFKSSHAKRRVVTESLITTIAQYMPTSGIVFLQSDVQSVLDDMRQRFREWDMYFDDSIANVQEYLPENILQIPTEREVSVLERDLPVYRALFTRNQNPYCAVPPPAEENHEYQLFTKESSEK